jgi:alpha-tubulin suppressor-like RCC1 family protein
MLISGLKGVIDIASGKAFIYYYIPFSSIVYVSTLVHVFFVFVFVLFFTGSAFNLAVCNDGSIYSWGLGESGELGREVRVIKPEGEDTTHDLDAILHDHLTPKKMIVKIKSMHNGKSILTEGEALVHCFINKLPCIILLFYDYYYYKNRACKKC